MLIRFFLPLLLALAACSGGYHTTQTPAVQQVGVSAAVGSDTATERVIAPYKTQLDRQMDQVIGQAPEELFKKEYESTLGNFVTDLMLVQARQYTKEPLDMAVTTNGGLRNPIPKGDVTVGHVYELMPFENELVVVQVKGSNLIPLFNLAAAKKTVPMSGATYNFLGGRAYDIRINKQPLDTARVYSVVASDYLANGGDNFTFFKGEKQLILGITVRQAILNHIQQLTAAGKPITAKIEGRVQVVE